MIKPESFLCRIRVEAIHIEAPFQFQFMLNCLQKRSSFPSTRLSVNDKGKSGSLIVNAAWHSIIRKLIDYVGKANERLKWNCEGKFCTNIVILVDELKRDFDNWKKKKKNQISRMCFHSSNITSTLLLFLYFIHVRAYFIPDVCPRKTVSFRKTFLTYQTLKMRKENKIFCLLVVKASFKVYVRHVFHFTLHLFIQTRFD